MHGVLEDPESDDVADEAGRVTVITKMKFKRKNVDIMAQRLKLLQILKVVSGRTMLRIILARTQLVKELLIINLQSKEEVFIPPELSMLSLPASFRFYDPTLRIINAMMPVEAFEK